MHINEQTEHVYIISITEAPGHLMVLSKDDFLHQLAVPASQSYQHRYEYFYLYTPSDCEKHQWETGSFSSFVFILLFFSGLLWFSIRFVELWVNLNHPGPEIDLMNSPLLGHSLVSVFIYQIQLLRYTQSCQKRGIF